jgi:hypothetical protein
MNLAGSRLNDLNLNEPGMWGIGDFIRLTLSTDIKHCVWVSKLYM